MIVISSALSLALAATPGANHPVFGWQNLVTAAGIDADHEDPLYPATNLANVATNLKWKSGSDADQYLTFDISALQLVDYIAVQGHNWGSKQIVNSVEYLSSTGPDVWTELVEENIPADDRALVLRFVQTSLAHQKIRIKLQPPTDAEPTAGVIFVGKLLVMERSFPDEHSPIDQSPNTDAVTGEADGGEFLGSIIRKQTLNSGVAFQSLRSSWYREYMRPFIDYANLRNPFFFAWAPQSHPAEVGYSWLKADAKPNYKPQIDRTDISLQFGGKA